jgi:DNA gyrase subunit A
MDSVHDNAELIVITENGYGKRTPLSEYRTQTRGGKGYYTIKRTEKTGELVAFKVVKPGDDLMIITKEGIIIRISVDDASIMGRYTQGVTLMRLNDNDQVVAVAKVMTKEAEDV